MQFVHAGHTAAVTDFCWDPNDAWVVASVAEDNILHVWMMVRGFGELVAVARVERGRMRGQGADLHLGG